MTIARIENGAVAEIRNIAIDDIPEHKRHAWMTCEGDRPQFDEATHVISGPVYQIEAELVLKTWTITPRPVSVADVKQEAQRRIISLTGAADLISCMIKQSNANMRANKLNDKRIGGEDLTADEIVESSGLRLMASAIEAIRDASNAIELDPPATMSELLTDPRWP